MSYRNPKQFLDSTANPFAEGLDKAFDNMKVEIEKDLDKAMGNSSIF